MHRTFFFLTGENFSNRRNVEPGDIPSFSLTEIETLLKAFFPNESMNPRYSMHRIMEADLPELDVKVTTFLRRSVSVQYIGSEDSIWFASNDDVGLAIQEFMHALPSLHSFTKIASDFRDKGHAFAIAQTVHAIHVPKNTDAEIKATIGRVMRDQSNFHVDLATPDLTITPFITVTTNAPRKVVIIISFHCTAFHTRGFKERIAKNRPIFEIGTMNPPLTSLMVNAAHPPRKLPALLFDPFCGTGGIMIEALVRGIASIGIDVDYHCIKGSITNLRFYSKGKKAGYHVVHASTFSLPFRDAAFTDDTNKDTTVTVTDPPYGRLESLKQAPFEAYVRKLCWISRFHAVLCFAMPDTKVDEVLSLVKDIGNARSVVVHHKREHATFARSIVILTMT